jgi:hypothetical protein
MITSLDAEYIQTKKLKNGQTTLSPPFDELALWISAAYQVEVLNIIYDRVIPDDRPRLQIILEFGKDKNKFIGDEFGNFNKTIQTKIKDKFIEIITRDNIENFGYDMLFVVFSEFDRVAIEEANSKVTDRDLEDLKNEFNNPYIWKIRPRFGSVTVFLNTEEQQKECEKRGCETIYSEKYLSKVKKYDEFGYISSIIVELDSKENFEKRYQGSWFYYDR